MDLKFIPIDYDYFDFDGRNYIKIVGRDSKGKRVCVIDSCDVYFWAILKEEVSNIRIQKLKEEISKIQLDVKGRKTRVENVEIHDKKFMGRDVKALKIFATNYKDLHDIADQMGMDEIEKRRGYDLGYITHYIIEKKMIPLNWYEIKGEVLNNSLEFGGIDVSLEVDLCLKLESLEALDDSEFKPQVLAFDIETDEFRIGKGKILMISLVSENFKKVITWKKSKEKLDFVEHVKDEAELIEKFVEYTKKISPDFLVGYFSDGFDMPYLKARAEENGVKLSLGLDGSQPTFHRGAVLTCRVDGIVHLDVLKFVDTAYSQYMQSETLSLNDVSKEFLGDTKKEFEFKSNSEMSENDWRDYFEYNLHDSVLTYKLFFKFWQDMVEFSRVMQEPVFEVSRNGMSKNVESYIIHNLEKFNEIPEKRPMAEEIGKRRMRGKYEGAFVFQPTPGLYEDVALFDFTSYWPSIIVTFNLSASTLLQKKEKDSLEVDTGQDKLHFSKNPGFFPEMLKEIILLRKKYKQELKNGDNAITRARSNAFKLLANASYGYQGFFGARYYCPEASAATTSISRDFIKKMIDEIDKAGFKTIYSDSVSGDTKIIVKKSKEIYEERIESLFRKADSKKESGKEYDLRNDAEVLTLDEKGNSTFKPIKYIMRHKSGKKMFRVHFTNNWHIDITEDHSLMGYQATNFNQSKKNRQNTLNRIIELKPDEIKKKTNTIISLKKIPYENSNSKNFPKEVYEFMGYFIGDGSFMRNKAHEKAGKDYYLRLSLGKDEEELIHTLINPLINKGYIKNFWKSKMRKGDVTFNGLKLVNLITKDFRDNKGKKIIPLWLFEEKEENIASFLRGLFSADGCVMIRNNAPIIKFTSIYDDYIEFVRKLLYRIGISHSVFRENNVNKYRTKNKTYSSGSYSKSIILQSREEFMQSVGFLLDRKNKRGNIKTRSLKKKFIEDFEFDLQSVKEIEEIPVSGYVYDLEVEDNHRFFANYVLAHNTDSIAFLKNGKSSKETFAMLEELNEKLPGIMELELEDFYKRGIWVTKRTGEFGAKKKYALIGDNGKLKIRGFETVRRDWCNLARETQNKVLRMILEDGTDKRALEFVRDVAEKIKKRKIDKSEILVRTQLKKPISEYKSISPHVVAAKKMEEKHIPIDEGALIEYYISEQNPNGSASPKKKGLVRDRVKLAIEEGEYDIDYYLKHQILPAVENIFQVFGIDINTVLDKKKQKTLAEF